MKIYFQLQAHWFICLLVAFLCIPTVFAQHYQGLGTATKPHTVVFKLKATSSAGTARMAGSETILQQAVQTLGNKVHRQKFPNTTGLANSRTSGPSDISLIYELQYKAGISFEQVKRTLMATGLVAYVEPLYLREPFHQPNDPAADSTKTDLHNQYYLKLIQAYNGWDVEKGDATVVIGILDTGFLLSHTELQGKVAQNLLDPIDGIDNDKDGYVDNLNGWDFADNDNDVTDNSTAKGHGMGVAGVAVAKTNNSTGIAGVGYNVKFMPLKIFGGANQGEFRGYEAILYAAEKGCKVINLSWGGEGYSQYEQDIINYVVLEKDVVVIAAAGNTNKKIDYYPASYNHVISVAGSTQQNVKVAELTYSYTADLVAPSKDIYTTHATHNDGYNLTSGSSFGAPMVAGTAALVRSRYPQLNALQVMERVRATADNIYHLAGNAPYHEMLGKGRLNVKRALKETNVKSVRCISFKTERDRPLQSGTTTNIFASFTNYLSPVQNLQVTLTSPSPYVTITQGSLSFGGITTSGTVHNTAKPFKITVSADAPSHTLVPFRIGYADGSYTDFQYFELLINPEFVTLDTDHLQLTFNGKGNIGYNGLDFNQGIGLTYKTSNSMLYQGGLIVSAGPDKVSDNLHNTLWKNDENFTSITAPKVRYNTPLADQEMKGVMKDKYPDAGNVGVDIKYKAYTWNTTGNQDFIIVEYQIKNSTSATINTLHAGLYADWDIGSFQENAAGWDAARLMGYAYNKQTALPYTGIKLLTNDTPSYYAFDNTILNKEDGFTDAEKHKTLSQGVTQSKAGTTGKGSNIAQVVGAVAQNLAPGQVKTITFAILAGDNLDALQRNAEAAQQKYISIKTGPVPLALQDTVCVGSTATWVPAGGQDFKFYADAKKEVLLGTGRSYSITNFTKQQTLYATNVDSLFESAVGTAVFSLPLAPEADFTYNSESIFPGMPVQFSSQSKNSKNFSWKFTDKDSGTGETVLYSFAAPGAYQVTLTATDPYNCTTSSSTKTVNVLPSTPTVLEQVLTFYPNPASGNMQIKLLPDGDTGLLPLIILVDPVGRQITPKITPQGTAKAILHLDGIAAGIYHVKVIYSHASFIKRIVVL